MRYKLTKESLPRVTELCQLIESTRARLGALGREAQREWDHLRARFPSNDDLYQGYISLSDVDVEELHASLRRFCENVAAPAPLSTRRNSSRGLAPTDRPLQPAA